MKKGILFLLIIGLMIPMANAGFEHEDIDQDLDVISKIKLAIKDFMPLTQAGQTRNCDAYPSTSGIETVTKTITCEGNEALINLYYIDQNGGWSYLYEQDAPFTFNKGNYNQWAWECYYCAELQDECINGQRFCYTETSYKQCANGEWSNKINCNYDEYCSVGYCHKGCQENWHCTAWGLCTCGGKEYRTCEDTNNCGTTSYKPTTVASCIKPTSCDNNDEDEEDVEDEDNNEIKEYHYECRNEECIKVSGVALDLCSSDLHCVIEDEGDEEEQIDDCGEVPTIPCDGAVWVSYPTCQWNLMSCESQCSIPPTEVPCDSAIWKDYPSCEWDESECKTTNILDEYKYWIIAGGIIFSILYLTGMFALFKGRRKKR